MHSPASIRPQDGQNLSPLKTRAAITLPYFLIVNGCVAIRDLPKSCTKMAPNSPVRNFRSSWKITALNQLQPPSAIPEAME